MFFKNGVTLQSQSSCLFFCVFVYFFLLEGVNSRAFFSGCVGGGMERRK